jgi:ribosomal protein S18 acetylase RimI-like enzyme
MELWGRGYGTEATRMMLAHAFQNLGIHRVSLAVFAFNERAIRSYRKVGFTVEGRAREAIFRDGRFWDEISMSILEPEWRALQGPDRTPATEEPVRVNPDPGPAEPATSRRSGSRAG